MVVKFKKQHISSILILLILVIVKLAYNNSAFLFFHFSYRPFYSLTLIHGKVVLHHRPLMRSKIIESNLSGKLLMI